MDQTPMTPGAYIYDVLAEHSPTPGHEVPYTPLDTGTGTVTIIDDNGQAFSIELDHGRLKITHRRIRTSDTMAVMPIVSNAIIVTTVAG